jgi:hypothetical protein
VDFGSFDFDFSDGLNVISQKKPRQHKKTEGIGSGGTYEANEVRSYPLAEHILVLLNLPISHHSDKSQ